ncbi:hypothetical protein PSSHI_28360 [Photobacterium sp. R1]
MAFNGLKKEEYWETADITSQSLNNEGLESYGLLKESLKDEINDSETIGEFIQFLKQKQRSILKRLKWKCKKNYYLKYGLSWLVMILLK